MADILPPIYHLNVPILSTSFILLFSHHFEIITIIYCIFGLTVAII